MTPASFTEKMAEDIIASDQSSARFERFCVELFSECDGVEYVPTSASWDLGSDGRPVGLHTEGAFGAIACSLRDDVPAKVMEDLQRLMETTSPSAIRVCSSQRLSEKKRQEIIASLHHDYPAIETIVADGVLQIASLLPRRDSYAQAFERFYATELRALREALSTTTGAAQEARLTGMRIALTTQLTDRGDRLRTDILKNLILTVLSDKVPRTTAAIGSLIAAQLHIGKCPANAYFEPALAQMMKDNAISLDKGNYAITDAGLAVFAALTEAGARVLLEGQNLVRAAIQELTGNEMTDDDFGKVWSLLQDELSKMFFENGMAVIESIASITKNGTADRPATDLSDSVVELSRKVEHILLGGPIAQDIGQAIIDMFLDKESPPFRWLTDLATCYVSLCALGLEPTAQDAILGRLRDIELILDTDLILSLLSEGEQDHEAILAAVNAWRRIGGRLWIAKPVLEEVAHHAYISQIDFDEVLPQLGKYNSVAARRLVNNAFVRGYWAVCHRQRLAFSRAGWDQYIGNFRGASKIDYSRILEELSEFGIHEISDDHVDPKLADEVAHKVRDLKKSSRHRNDRATNTEVIDKSERDGRLVALLSHYRKKLQEVHRTAVIVSSSTILKRVCASRAEIVGRFRLCLSGPLHTCWPWLQMHTCRFSR
jgi:hypothetical protein